MTNHKLNWIFVVMFLAISINMVSAYNIRINFYDENSLSAIPTVTITDSNGSTYTSDVNGLWVADLTGAKDLTISKTGYDSRKLQFYFKTDANYNFLLNPTGLDSNIGFIVKDSNNNLWGNKYLMFNKNITYEISPNISDTINSSWSGTTTSNVRKGYVIIPNRNIYLMGATTSNSSTATQVEIRNGSTTLGTATVSSHIATFTTPILLLSGVSYGIIGYNGGSNYNWEYKSSPSYPVNKTYYSIPSGLTETTADPNYYYNIQSINIRLPNDKNTIINSLLTSSTGTATANLLANGDYNAILYTSDGNFSEIYVKTTVTVNKPKDEIIGSAISPYDITVGGLLGYSLSNQTASSVSFNVFAGTQDFYYFSVVDYNAVIADRKYIPRQYFVQVPMGSGYYSAITYQPYLLSEIDAVVPKITVLDQFNKPIGEVDVFISRYINNVLTIVESGKTTNTGTLSFSAYPLEYYYINVLYNDVDKGTYRIQPRESADNFIIVIDTTSTEFITDLLVIDANFAGTAKTVNIDDSNITADVTITQNLNQATSYNLYLMQGNTVKASTTGIISGLTTNISYEFDCSVLDKFNSNIVLKLVVNYPDGNQTFYYTITATKNQNGLLYFAPRVINDIGQPLGIILAILITGIILAGLTFSGLNIGSTAIAIMGVLILSVFMFLGWLDVGVKVLGFDIARFFFVLMAFAIVYLVMRGEQYA